MSEPFELPWLLVHGGVFWKVLLIATTIIVFVLALAARRGIRMLQHRHRARHRIRALRSRVVAPADGHVVLEGVLFGGGVRALHFNTKIAIDRDEALLIQCGGEAVVLDGDIVLAHGTRCTQASWALPPSTPEAMRELATGRVKAARLVEVVRGDRVLVEGIASRGASRQEAGHREQAGSWRLKAIESHIRMCAVAPATPARPMHRAHKVMALFPILVAVYVGLRLWGSMELRDLRRLEGPLDAASLDQYTIAAALPGSRPETLRLIDNRMANAGLSELPVARAFARFRGGCRGEAATLALYEEHDETIRLAHTCPGTERFATEALILAGRFDEATRGLDARETIWASHAAAAAGDWTQAARAATANADWHRLEHEPWHKKQTVVFDCLAAMFGAWAGDDAARARTLQLAKTSRLPICILAAGEVVDEAERITTLKNLWPDNLESDYQAQWIAQATEAADGGPLGNSIEHVGGSNGEELAKPVMWLAPWIVGRWAGMREPTRAYMLGREWRARLRLISGDREGARTDAEWLENQQPETFARLLIRDLVALRGTAKIKSGERIVDELGWRTGQPPGRSYFDERDPTWRAATHAAALGNGWALAAKLRTEAWLTYEVVTLLAVAPLVRIGRAELARSVRHIRIWSSSRMPDPFERINHAANRRDLARMLGDTAEEARWQQIIDRHVAVFSDRRRLMALLLWTADF